MYRIIFRHRWAAVLFVLLVVAGAMRLVGTPAGDGQLAEMQRQVTEQHEQFEQATAGEPDMFPDEMVEDEAEPEIGLGEETNLDDSTEGFDPTPREADNPADNEEQVELLNPDEQDF